MPLRHASQHFARGQACSRNNGLREAMVDKIDNTHALFRRSFPKAGGALAVPVGSPITLNTILGIEAAHAQGTKPPLTPDQLSSYIAVNADGTVSAYFGKMDLGQGLLVA